MGSPSLQKLHILDFPKPSVAEARVVASIKVGSSQQPVQLAASVIPFGKATPSWD